MKTETVAWSLEKLQLATVHVGDGDFVIAAPNGNEVFVTHEAICDLYRRSLREIAASSSSAQAAESLIRT